MSNLGLARNSPGSSDSETSNYSYSLTVWTNMTFWLIDSCNEILSWMNVAYICWVLFICVLWTDIYKVECVETLAVFVIEYDWGSHALICFAVYEYATIAVVNECVLLSLCFLMLLLLHAFVCYLASCVLCLPVCINSLCSREISSRGRMLKMGRFTHVSAWIVTFCCLHMLLVIVTVW